MKNTISAGETETGEIVLEGHHAVQKFIIQAKQGEAVRFVKYMVFADSIRYQDAQTSAKDEMEAVSSVPLEQLYKEQREYLDIGGNDEFDCIYLHPDDLTVYVEHGMESYRSGVIRAMARDLGVELSEEIMQALVCDRLKRQLVSENPEKLENNAACVKVRRRPELVALPAQINLGGRELEVLHTPIITNSR